jgi:hypothetical protein
MQTAAIVRAVFIKTTKKTTTKLDTQEFITEVQHLFWENKFAVQYAHEVSIELEIEEPPE